MSSAQGTLQESAKVYLPQGGPNTILINILTMARFGSTRRELFTSQVTEGASYSLVRACLGYLLSHSLVEEEKVELYQSQFGAATRSTYFTTEKGFRFLRNYVALAHLAGDLGEGSNYHERSRISMP